MSDHDYLTVTLTLERPITPGDLEQAYCKLEATLK